MRRHLALLGCSVVACLLYGRCVLDLTHTLEHAPRWRSEQTTYARQEEYATEDVGWWARWRGYERAR